MDPDLGPSSRAGPRLRARHRGGGCSDWLQPRRLRGLRGPGGSASLSGLGPGTLRGRERGAGVGSLLLQTRLVTGPPAQLALAGCGREDLMTKGRGGRDRGAGSSHTGAGSQKRTQVGNQEGSWGGLSGCGVGCRAQHSRGRPAPLAGRRPRK